MLTPHWDLFLGGGFAGKAGGGGGGAGLDLEL